MIELDSCTSKKSIAIQTNSNVKVTTHFMKGKMLMFAKTPIISFIYDMIDVFCFPRDNRKVQATYDKHRIEKCFLYQNLTDKTVHLYSLFIVAILIVNWMKKIQEMWYLK